MAARTLNLMLGLWLFSSAFMWPRSRASAIDTAAVALAICAFSVGSMLHKTWLRFVNTALSAWLVAAAFVLPRASDLAFRNDVAVGLALLAISVVPGSIYPRVEHQRLATQRP